MTTPIRQPRNDGPLEDAEQLNELLGPDDYAELLEDEDH